MNSSVVLSDLSSTVDSYHRMIHATVDQLTDQELWERPRPGFNSVAILLRHLGGNLRSRWTDFLHSDGEKPDRDRDQEFQQWEGDRASLLEYFESGWQQLVSAMAMMDSSNMQALIKIRGENHTLLQALIRSVTHCIYHCGQIVMIARMVHQGDWNWLTIEPNASKLHNQSTWGSSASRSILGERDRKDDSQR